MPKLIDLEGKKFGKWLVLSRAPNVKNHGDAMWHVQCECGIRQVVSGYSLRSGNSTSCGLGKHSSKYVHGQGSRYCRTPTFVSWHSMISRCNRDSSVNGRYRRAGIKVCHRWLDFENFFEDMGERPEGKTLDRINSYGNYFPENCTWSTPKEQRDNQCKYYVK